MDVLNQVPFHLVGQQVHQMALCSGSTVGAKIASSLCYTDVTVYLTDVSVILIKSVNHLQLQLNRFILLAVG
jgi:hypothetical protein